MVTVSFAGSTLMAPSTNLTFSFEVTSSPWAFLMTSTSAVAATSPSETFVAVALDAAASSV